MVFGIDKLVKTTAGKIITGAGIVILSVAFATNYKQVLKYPHNVLVKGCSVCHHGFKNKKQVMTQDYFNIIAGKDTTKVDLADYFQDWDSFKRTGDYFRDATLYKDTTLTYTGLYFGELLERNGFDLDSLVKNHPYLRVSAGDGYNTFYETKELFKSDTTSMIALDLVGTPKYGSPFQLIVAGKTANFWPHGIVEFLFK